jgi:PAS domain S-box-containing protein
LSSDFFRNQQYFKALTESSIVSKSNTKGTIIYVNDNFCKVTGYTEKEMIGHSHNLFRHPDNPDSLFKELWTTINAGKIWRGRMINRNKDGSDFIAESTIIPLVDEEGKIHEFMAIRNDITDTVKLKREIFLKEQEKIEQEKIREAQKSFLLLFTHELKTPLNAIINFTKYIRKQIESPKAIDQKKLLALLDTVSDNAADMLETITMILETSKLNTHKLTYNYTLFSLNELITVALTKYDSLINEKNIKLIQHSDRDVFIYSDILRIQQIFSNILSNAIKYGNDEIIITLRDTGTDTVIISIEDNGPGIQDKEAIFDLYVQESENFLQRKGQGTGIGLYFIKLLCQDLNIYYKIEDREEGGGTKFILSFRKKSKKSQSNGNV